MEKRRYPISSTVHRMFHIKSEKGILEKWQESSKLFGFVVSLDGARDLRFCSSFGDMGGIATLAHNRYSAGYELEVDVENREATP